MQSKLINLCLVSLLFTLTGGISYADTTAYTIDNAHTHIVWKVDRFGFSNTVGTFVDIQGQLMLDTDAIENSSVTVSIPLSGLRSDLKEREDIVLGPYWLKAQDQPDITFTSTQVSIDDSRECDVQCLRIKGNLTLKGVTAPVVLQAHINKIGTDLVTKKPAAGFTASGQFDRKAFGINTALGPIGQFVSFDIELLAVAGG